MIDMTLSTEETELTAAVREVAGEEFPLSEPVRAAVDGHAVRFDADRWARVVGLGWFQVSVPADRGGLGLGLPQEMLLLFELGKCAAGGPFIGTMLTAFALATDGGELLDAVVSGRRPVGLIVGGLVVDADVGDLALRASGGDSAELVEVRSVAAQPSLDESARVGQVTASTVVARLTGAELRPRLQVLLAAYLAGLAEATGQMSVSYAKTRERFGRPIGSFQAVKHRCADMAVRAYVAHALVAMAAVLADRPGTGQQEAAAAYLLAAEAAQGNAEPNVQNRGGVGFTAEHPAGVYVKRALTYRQIGGPSDGIVGTMLSSAETSVA
jgi:alkylation response protein AidB-like acyl-CoA dehydrogenase